MVDWCKVFKYESDGNLILLKSPRVSKRKRSGNYIRVKYQGSTYQAHRIIWEMFNGPIPDGFKIDHINGVKDDNRLDNLRLVTDSLNNRNKGRDTRNKSGYNGVIWNKQVSKWQAHIRVDGKSKHLGLFVNIADAVKARALAEAGLGFTSRHGN